MQLLDSALQQLDHALHGQPAHRDLRERLAAVLDALSVEPEAETAAEPWLTPRAGHLHREHDRLLTRARTLAAVLADTTDAGAVRPALQRLVLDLRHHRARLDDLVYDGVAMDVGGSD